MKHVFPYRITHLGKEAFERELAEKVFPKVAIRRRNVVDTRHELRELGIRDGQTEYMWLIHAEFSGGSQTGPPELEDLQRAMGPARRRD